MALSALKCLSISAANTFESQSRVNVFHTDLCGKSVLAKKQNTFLFNQSKNQQCQKSTVLIEKRSAVINENLFLGLKWWRRGSPVWRLIRPFMHATERHFRESNKNVINGRQLANGVNQGRQFYDSKMIEMQIAWDQLSDNWWNHNAIV